MASAAEFIPDREIPAAYFVASGLLVILIVGSYGLIVPKPRWDGIVTLDGVEYNDDVFDDDFDYSSLRDKKILLHKPLNRSMFIIGEHVEQEIYFSSKDEIRDILKELGAPEVVVGYTMWLSNGTWEEALERYYSGSDIREGVQTIGESFGVVSSSHVQYRVLRGNPNYPNSGVFVQEMFQSKPGEQAAVWVLHFNLFDSPPYQGSLFVRGTKRGGP